MGTKKGAAGPDQRSTDTVFCLQRSLLLREPSEALQADLEDNFKGHGEPTGRFVGENSPLDGTPKGLNRWHNIRGSGLLKMECTRQVREGSGETRGIFCGPILPPIW